MSWMGLSLRVRILSVIAILLALALIAIASWENAQGSFPPHRNPPAALILGRFS